MVESAFPDKQLLRLPEVAAFCGVHINTVRRWIEEGLLQSLMVGKQHRITRQAFFSFLQQKP